MLRTVLVVVALAIAGGAAFFVISGRGVFGSHEGPGEVTSIARPAATEPVKLICCTRPERRIFAV